MKILVAILLLTGCTYDHDVEGKVTNSYCIEHETTYNHSANGGSTQPEIK